MLVKRYRDRVVQKMRCLRDGRIQLTFPSTRKHEPRLRLVITQAEWDRYGSSAYEPGKHLDDFRDRAA
jgi:hypothetical protein